MGLRSNVDVLLVSLDIVNYGLVEKIDCVSFPVNLVGFSDGLMISPSISGVS